MKRERWAIAVGVLAVVASSAWGQEGTRFRGPDGQGKGAAAQLPVQWRETDIAWKTKLPGEGHSSPVLWGHRVFVTTWDEERGEGGVMALDGSTGRILWQQSYPLGRSRLHRDNSYASCTPAVNQESVFVSWLDGDRLVLVALGHDGQQQWTRDYGRVQGQHGIGGSPVLYRGLVILTQEQWEENNDYLQSRWLGVDQVDGAIRWELPRRNGKTSYGTPSLFTDASGRAQLIFTSQAHGITAIDPAQGKVLWEISDCFKDRTVASPVVAGDLIVGTAGGGGLGRTLVIVKSGRSGEPPKLLYATDKKGQIPYVPSTIAIGDRLYLFQDRGNISCWDLPTGRTVWSESIKARFYGSPVAIGDMLYCVTLKGELVIIKAGDEFQLLAVNPLGEACQTTPAVANNRLYVRTLSSLVCVSGTRLSKRTAVR